MAEKAGFLTLSDSVIAGIFIEAQMTLKNNPAQVKIWEECGKIFLKSRRGSSSSIEITKNPGKHSSNYKTNIEGEKHG